MQPVLRLVRLPKGSEKCLVALAAIHHRGASSPLEDLVETHGQLRRNRGTAHLRGQSSEVADRNRPGHHSNCGRSAYTNSGYKISGKLKYSLTVALRELVLDSLHVRLSDWTLPDLPNHLLVLVVGAVPNASSERLPSARSA